MKYLVVSRGLEGEFEIDSAATTYDEEGNPIYPPARRKLAEHGVAVEAKPARRITAEDYQHFDHIIGMDRHNMRDMMRFWNGDPDNKLSLLMQHAGSTADVADPWYTRNYEVAYRDILAGCTALLDHLVASRPPHGTAR